jgi:hypothetical protein
LRPVRAADKVNLAETGPQRLQKGRSQMRHRIVLATSVAVLLASSAVAAEALKSGPQPGDSPTPFNPLHVTGADAGTKECPV